jgi:hypothetical protein
VTELVSGSDYGRRRDPNKKLILPRSLVSLHRYIALSLYRAIALCSVGVQFERPC